MSHKIPNTNAGERRDATWSSYAMDPLNEKKCPVCGKEAATKYYNETKKVYIYKHPRRYAASIICEARK